MREAALDVPGTPDAPDTMGALDRDWLGGPAPDGPRWALWARGGRLRFRAAAGPPPVSAGAGEGEFAEGLWEGDVAELFLLNPGTGFYMEFNLSPGGAWWCCAFDAPRVRASGGPAPLPGVEARAAGTDVGWEAELAVPLASLPRALAFDAETTRGNVAFCLGRPQRHFTLADLGGGRPDFHRPSKWPPLRGLLGAPMGTGE
jgi:hypothetical protein